MNYSQYPDRAKKDHPSLCHKCSNAVKPGALKIAEQGFVGCAAHMDKIKRSYDMGAEELAAEMVQNGIQCEQAVTGWSSAIPIRSIAEISMTYNGILMVKGCTVCPYFTPNQKQP